MFTNKKKILQLIKKYRNSNIIPYADISDERWKIITVKKNIKNFSWAFLFVTKIEYKKIKRKLRNHSRESKKKKFFVLFRKNSTRAIIKHPDDNNQLRLKKTIYFYFLQMKKTIQKFLFPSWHCWLVQRFFV